MRKLFRENKQLFLYIAISNFLLIFGFRIWQVTFNNFAVEAVGIGPEGVGWVQSIRELPGLLTFLVAFLALLFSELRIMGISIILLGTGLILTGYSASIPMLLAATLIMSFGFHFFGPSTKGVVLMSIDTSRTPRVLGQLKSLGAVASVLATATVYLLATRLGYQSLFYLVGVLVIAGGVLLLIFGGGDSDRLPNRRHIVFRRRYWVFYSLAFLMGSRRHIFTTFAIFLLVSEYHITIETTAVLFLVNSLINIYAYSLIGGLITKLGERLILTVAALLLIPAFLGYAYVSYVPVLFVLFVLDNVLFGSRMAVTTYLQKIAQTQEEITTNLSMQTTINHISAVIVPVIGGTVWVVFGAQAPFLFGVAIASLTLLLAQFVNTEPTSTKPDQAAT